MAYKLPVKGHIKGNGMGGKKKGHNRKFKRPHNRGGGR